MVGFSLGVLGGIFALLVSLLVLEDTVAVEGNLKDGAVGMPLLLRV